jgi:hypothetical protein
VLEQLDHILKDAHCQAALEDLKVTCSLTDWLNKNESLYRSLVICPKGLPPLASCHFDGVEYEYMRKFTSLYGDLKDLF